MAFVNELYVIHQAALPPVYKEWQSGLTPWHRRDWEILPVLLKWIFLDLLFAPKLAAGKRMKVYDV